MNNKIAATVTIVLLLVVMQITSAEEMDGENLIQPQPFPEGPWKQMMSQNKREFTSVIWGSAVPENNDTLMTSVYRGANPGFIDDLRTTDEATGKQACGKLISETIKSEKQNGYQILVWKITCKNAFFGTKMVALNKAIAGKDAAYQIRKAWWPNPSDESWAAWISYFDKVNVCDSRQGDRKCPEGLERIK